LPRDRTTFGAGNPLATPLLWQPRSPDNDPLLFVIPTRISCHAALDTVAYAPFSEGKAHEARQRHQYQQEIRGSEADLSRRAVEGSAVSTLATDDAWMHLCPRVL
jgi:hypothetical protein